VPDPATLETWARIVQKRREALRYWHRRWVRPAGQTSASVFGEGRGRSAGRAGPLRPVASDPTVSRLIDTLAAYGDKALRAIRSARAEVRGHVRRPAGERDLDAGGTVTVDDEDNLFFNPYGFVRLTRPR
jgi:hypothetical protein